MIERAKNRRKEVAKKFEALGIAKGDILLITLSNGHDTTRIAGYFVVEDYSSNNMIGFFLDDYRGIPPYESINFEDIENFKVAVQNKSHGGMIIIDMAKELQRLKLRLSEVGKEVNRICNAG